MERAIKTKQAFYLPTPCINFFNTNGHMIRIFKNRNRYHKLRLGLQDVEKNELEEFKQFLNEKSNDKVAKLLMEKMSIPPMDPSQPPPYEDNNVVSVKK